MPDDANINPNSPSRGAAGSVTLTCEQLEKLLKDCQWQVESAPGEDPPAGYEALAPEHAEVADACFHRGMEYLSVAVLNWAYDQLHLPNTELRHGAKTTEHEH